MPRRFTGPVRRPCGLGLLLAGVLALAACARPEPVQVLRGAAQGTTWQISVWHPDGVDGAALQQRLEAELDRIDEVLSNYRPDSVIERFNAQETTAPVTVGAEIVELVRAARQVSEASQGCYDLTVQPLLALWGFSGDSLTPPDAATLAQAVRGIGFAKLETQPPESLRKLAPRVHVDLSSIAQGYSVGRLAAVVEAVGIDNYLVELGGELQARGHKPGGAPWRIGVERPAPGGGAVERVLTLRAEAPVAVMTSGTYRHYFDAEGRRYSHILDARTGAPVTHNTVSVTVVDSDPTRADAWSTALLCLGREAGVAVADRHRIAALFIAESSGGFEETATAAWRSLTTIEID